MTPTPRLRFVERHKELFKDPDTKVSHGVKLRVLQQWYAYDIDYPTEKGEWKDVPLEEE